MLPTVYVQYESLLAVEMSTRSSQTDNFYTFSPKSMIYRGRVLIKKAWFSDNSLHNIMLRLKNNFNKLWDLKTDLLEG